MGIFLDKLRLEEHGTDEWFLLSDYSYKTTAINPELYKTITAPARFINDLASIPRLFQSLIPKVGKHRGAAVIHDWIYYNKGRVAGLELSRKQADQIFLDGMKSAGVKFIRRQAMYAAVRAGGWVYWNKKDKANRMASRSLLQQAKHSVMAA